MLITNPIIYRGHPVGYDDLSAYSKLPLIFECELCHKPFKTTKYQIVRNGHEYCQPCAIKMKLGKSLPIGGKYGRLTVIEPSSISGHSVCHCDCGNIVTVANHSLKTGHSRSCGCLQKEQASINIKNAHPAGELHPNWKGGISSEWSRLTSTKKYKGFRDAVFTRDNNCCRRCGSIQNLHIHHMQSFSTNPSLRMDIDNAICLCKSCHEEFHRTYGKKYNTREQIIEFIS